MGQASIARKSSISFAEIQQWSDDDSFLLDRETLSAVRDLTENTQLRLRLIAMAMARRKLKMIERFAEQVGEIEPILFSPERLAQMKTPYLLKLFEILTGRQTALMDSLTKQTDERREDSIISLLDRLIAREQVTRPELASAEERVSAAVVRLADFVATKESGTVPFPPSVV